MARFPTLFILIPALCQLTVSSDSEDLEELVGALDGPVIFPVNVTPAVGNKKANVIVTQNRNKERIFLLDRGYSLKLSKLKKNDSGVYSVEIYRSSSDHPVIKKYKLHVYEHLSMPKVTSSPQSSKNGTCMANLTCSVEQGEDNVTYSWKILGQETNECHDGSILPVSWTVGETNTTFICTARNPISSNSSRPVLAWKLCEEPTKVKNTLDNHQEILNFSPHSEAGTVYDTVSSIHTLVAFRLPAFDPPGNKL
ncbi:SLAM family member 7 [Ctenodactylus gundi]